MKQFRKIFNFELKYYLKNKVFAGVTVFLVLLIAVVMFFPRIMEAFKSGDDSTESAARSSRYADKTRFVGKYGVDYKNFCTGFSRL